MWIYTCSGATFISFKVKHIRQHGYLKKSEEFHSKTRSRVRTMARKSCYSEFIILCKKSRNIVTRLIRQEKNRKQLLYARGTFNPKHINKSSKSWNSQNDDLKQLPTHEKLNDILVAVGATSASIIETSPCVWKIEQLQSSMVLQSKGEQENCKFLGQMRNKKTYWFCWNLKRNPEKLFPNCWTLSCNWH